MHGTLRAEVAGAIKIDGHLPPRQNCADKNVPHVVGEVCKAIWKGKTDAVVAVICDCDPRNARRYFKGELPIPSVLLAAINNRLVERE